VRFLSLVQNKDFLGLKQPAGQWETLLGPLYVPLNPLLADIICKAKRILHISLKFVQLIMQTLDFKCGPMTWVRNLFRSRFLLLLLSSAVV
jgi:hypothetical protein